MIKQDPEQLFACGLWVALIVIQIVFIVVRALGLMQLHWTIVCIPGWTFLSLPFVSYFGVKLLEKGK